MLINIFDFGMNGEGVGKLDGKITLVDFLLPNEIADIEIIEDFSNYSIGKIKSIQSKSGERKNPPCPYFYTCGGCALQHMSYPLQLKFKQELVQKTIKKITNLEVSVEETVPCDVQYKYRNKVSFNVVNEQVGFYKTSSHEIVEIENCLLCSDSMNLAYNYICEYLKCKEYLNKVKHIVIREIEEQMLIGIVVNKHINLNPLYSVLLDKIKDKKIGIYEILNTRSDQVVLSGKTTHIAGIKDIEIHEFGLTYYVDLLGFHQTNINIQNKIYNYVLKYISASDVVVNAFSGAGLLTAIIARKAKKVIGIEIDKNSHISAEKLKAENKISNMTNILGDFNREIEKITDYNTLILDPAKKGCGKQILSKIDKPEKIIYISCNPIALSKDLNYLKDKYEIEKIIPFDMFCNTSSVETVIILKKK